MSTGTVGAIKGGMAYVQAFLDDNPLTQGLGKLQTKLKTWQASLSKMGAGAYGGELPEPFAAIARFAASPAGAFTGLLAAAHHTATAREEMLRMSETTGVAVEKLSALSYAARRAGISNEALASGLRKMQSKEFQAAMGGGKGGKGMQGIMAGLGLGGGDAADQLRQVIKQFEGLDAVSRAGLAKKLGISDLLPLINQGIGALDAFTARAKELGLVMSEEDARAAKRFTLALGDLHDVIKSSISAIGGALVPVITGLTNLIVPVVVKIRDWLKEHRALTMAIFLGTGAIVAGGIALKAFAVASGLASIALGVLKGVVLATSVAWTVLTTAVGLATTVLNLVQHPFLAIGAAVIGLAGYLAYTSGAFDGLRTSWQSFAEETSSSIKAIFNAIAKGDLAAAWDVVLAYFRLEWARVTGWIDSIWGKTCDWMGSAWNDAITGIGKFFIDSFYNTKAVFAYVIGSMYKGWVWLTSNLVDIWKSTQNWLSKKFVGMMEFFGVYDEDEANQQREILDKDFQQEQARRQKEAQDKLDAITKDRDAAFQDQIDQREAAKEALDEDADLRDRAREAEAAKREKDLADELAAKREALRAAQDAANAVETEKKNEKPKKAFAAMQASETNRGTFSGAVAAMIGGGSNPVVKAIEEGNQYSERQIELHMLEVERMEQIQNELKALNTVN